MTQKQALDLLKLSGYLFTEEGKAIAPALNMNDVWAWALAYSEPIPPDKLIEVAELYRNYGFCGLLYWISEQNQQMRSEFHDYNRMIDFVRKEEELKKQEPDNNRRAYLKISYFLPIE